MRSSFCYREHLSSKYYARHLATFESSHQMKNNRFIASLEANQPFEGINLLANLLVICKL